MGLLANSTNRADFKITDPNGFMNEINDGQGSLPVILMDRLSANRFTSIENMAVEESKGWVSLFDHNDTEFQSGTTHIGDYLTFSLRVDKRRVPSAVLKAKVEEACRFYLTETGTAKVPKQKKAEITDAAREVLLARAFPIPATYDVSWHLESGTVTLFNVSVKGQELFYDLFKKTFPELGLRLVTPYDRAMAILTNRYDTEHAQSDYSLTVALKSANKASCDSVLELIKENAWIGTDFLSWLLYGTTESVIEPTAENDVNIWIDHKIMLVRGGDGAKKIVLTGDQSRLNEVKAALADGAKIGEARIFISDEGEEEYSLTLKGDTFAFSSFRTPAVKLERDDTVDELMERQAVFLERQHLMGKGMEHFERIFRQFLTHRLSAGWGLMVTDVEEWARGEA